VAFSADGKALAAGDGSGDVVVWNLAAGRQESAITLPCNASITALALSPAGTYAAAGCSSGYTFLWRLGASTWTTLDRPPASGVSTGTVLAAFSPDGSYLLSADQAGTASVWEVPGRRVVTSLTIPAAAGSVTELIGAGVSAGGQTVAIASNRGTVYLWPKARCHI
jgi:WD40 repeat protein